MAAAPPQANNHLSTAAFICGGLAVLVVPILVGGAAITCAVIARNRKETRAPAALAVAVGGTVAGFILSAIVRQNFY